MSTDKYTLKQKLFKLRKEVGKISKDSENPFFHSKYFDINKLIEQLEPLFEKHNLLLTQPIDEGEVCTIIMDMDSEDSVSSSIPLPALDDPQKIGSAITYYRRYTLASLLALQAEDDDGNTSSGKSARNGKAKKDDKPWLNEGTPEWEKTVKKIETGQVDTDTVYQHFKVNKKNRAELEEIEHQVQTNGVPATH